MMLFHQILELDRTLTLAINGWRSPFCDGFFFLFSRTDVWLPLFSIFVILLLRSYGWRTALSVLCAAALAVLLSDQLCNVIKFTVCRFRPTHEPSLVGMVLTVNDYVGGDYGFCSSHAANTVALAIFTSLVVRRWYYSLSLSTWVLLSCWSRVYLGVHYLGDIIFGLLIGTLVSLLVFFLWRKIKWAEMDENGSTLNAIVLVSSYFITVIILFLISVSGY